jgi:hypothetical protein
MQCASSLSILTCVILIAPRPLAAQVPVEPLQAIGIIREVADALGAVGDALGKLTDGIEHMIRAGDHGLSTLHARRTRESLIDLSRLTTELTVQQTTVVIPSLEDYLERPDTARWSAATAMLGDVIESADTLLTRLRRDKSDLVLRPAYAALQLSLSARVTLLSKLAALPPPSTKAELNALRSVLGRYRVLVAQLAGARDALNQYIASDST